MIGKYLPALTLEDIIRELLPCADTLQQFRNRLSALCGYRFAFLFRSARNALCAFLRSLGVSGSVLVPAYNCIAVPEAVTWAGWKPVFADIGAGTVNMTAESLVRALSDDISVVLLTHQFGIPAEIDSILRICRERGLFVIEDAAAALGAKYKGRMVGCFGHATLLSFHMTKVVNAGRGGALLTNDEELARRIAAIQDDSFGLGASIADFAQVIGFWGATRPWIYAPLRHVRRWIKEDTSYEVVIPRGEPAHVFSRCSSYVAGLAARQVGSLNSNVAARHELACIYADELAGLEKIRIPAVPVGAEPAWIQYPIFVERKKDCYEYLLNRGVDLNWTFRYSCGASYGVSTVPNAEQAARTILGLPTYPGLAPTEARRVCSLLRQFLNS
jgi:perosamine synthetase